jgi:hypothetical protein
MRDDDRLDVSYENIGDIRAMLISFQPSIIRLGILLLLFDVYLTWARLEKQTIPDAIPGASNLGRLAQQPIVFQYIFFRKITYHLEAVPRTTNLLCL